MQETMSSPCFVKLKPDLPISMHGMGMQVNAHQSIDFKIPFQTSANKHFIAKPV